MLPKTHTYFNFISFSIQNLKQYIFAIILVFTIFSRIIIFSCILPVFMHVSEFLLPIYIWLIAYFFVHTVLVQFQVIISFLKLKAFFTSVLVDES